MVAVGTRVAAGVGGLLGVGVAAGVGATGGGGVTAGAGVRLGVAVGVGSARRAVETIQPVHSPAWTFRQIRPSDSRSIPTIVTSVPSGTDVTTPEPVPGSRRM